MKFLSYTLLISFALVLYSCNKVIDFDLNKQENSRLVVEGNLTDQAKVHTVKLTRTSSYYESQPAPKETGATVTISDGTTSHTLTETSPGIYQTAATYKGEIGKTYTLDITTTNNDTYTASSTITPVTHIDTILTDMREAEVGEGGEGKEGMVLALEHFGPEPATPGNNYMWMVTINGTNVTSTVTDLMFVTDEFVNGNYISGFVIHEEEELDIPLTDTLRINVEMHSISKAYHDFLLAIVLETEYSGELFSGPPANIPSNISNGGLGFFRASAVSTEYLEIENPLLE